MNSYIKAIVEEQKKKRETEIITILVVSAIVGVLLIGIALNLIYVIVILVFTCPFWMLILLVLCFLNIIR